MIAPVELLCAFFLDLVIGDPRWLPHPVQIIGRGVTAVEGLLRSLFGQRGEKAAGVFLVIAIVLPATMMALALNRLLISFSSPVLMAFGMIILVYLMSTTLALRGLVGAVRLVVRAVGAGNTASARKNLSMIVGRDTDRLEDKAILRASIETLAENLSDGFVAPLFYLVVGGLPLAVAYKAINTLDSMVGYRNERYLRFGWAAARLDDVANYLPARITGLAISAAAFFHSLGSNRKTENGKRKTEVVAITGASVAPSGSKATGAFPSKKRWQLGLGVARNSFRIMLRDGRNHTSPNSGIPEAAMAGALRVRLGGPSTYGGTVVEKPHIGDDLQNDYLASAERALHLALIAATLVVIVAVIVLMGRQLL